MLFFNCHITDLLLFVSTNPSAKSTQKIVRKNTDYKPDNREKIGVILDKTILVECSLNMRRFLPSFFLSPSTILSCQNKPTDINTDTVNTHLLLVQVRFECAQKHAHTDQSKRSFLC